MIYNCQLECGHVLKADLKAPPASASEVHLKCDLCHGLFHVLRVTSTEAFPVPTPISSAQAEAPRLRTHGVPIAQEVLDAGYAFQSVDAIIEASRVKDTWAEGDPSIIPETRGLPGDPLRFMKLYPCGCTAGPGPADMPDYCAEHGNPEKPEAITVSADKCACGCSHVPDHGACPTFEPGSDGVHCVYCDHALACHARDAGRPTYNLPLEVGRRDVAPVKKAA